MATKPTITGTHAGQTTLSEALVSPFSSVVIGDTNAGASDTLTVQLLGAGGQFVDAAFTQVNATTYSITGSAAAITAALQAATFTPAAGLPNTVNTTTFLLTDKSSASTTATATDATTAVVDTDPAVAPTIAGAAAAQATTSEASIHPFSTVIIGDTNNAATDTLTVTIGGTGGTLSGTGITGGTGGVYTLTGTATAVTAHLEAASFKAAAGQPNTVNTSTFALSDKSSAFATPAVNSSTTVIDTDPAVAPTITGATALHGTTSEAAVKPFTNVTIADANADATDTLTITVSGTGGTLSGTGITGGVGGVYTITGSAASITTALDAASFTATAGQPRTVNTSTFTLSDSSSAFATPTVNATVTVTDTDPGVAPTITGTVADQAVTSEASINPFANVMINDPNFGAMDTLTIALGGSGGLLSGNNVTGGAGGIYTIFDAAAAITADIAGVTFSPFMGQPNTVNTTSFTLTDKSNLFATPAVDTQTSVIDTDPAVSPTITGTVSDQATTSEAPISPFQGVTIADPNSNATDSLTIGISVGGSGGTLSGTGITGGANGIYTITGTPDTITSELDGSVFVPNAGLPNTVTTTTLALTDVSNAFATPVVDATTTVINTDPAVAPTIAGTVADQNTTSEAPITPFANVVVGDVNSGAMDTLVISMDGTGGTLSGTGVTDNGDGTYTIMDTAANVTADLQAAVFVAAAGPDNSLNTSILTLTDTSDAYQNPVTDSTTTVNDIDPAKAPTITGTMADQATTSEAPVNPFANVVVTDTNNGAVDTMTITVGGTGGALIGAGLTGGANGVYTITDTADNITNDLNNATFVPNAGQDNTNNTSTFALSDSSSGYAMPVTDNTTTVINSDPSVSPTITGTVAGQTTTSEAPVTPFAGVTITDTNYGAIDTLTITVDDQGGSTLTGTGITDNMDGTYKITDTAANITAELDAAVFTPAAGLGNTVNTTTIELSDLSNAFDTPAYDNTTTVVDTDPALPPVISGTMAGQTTQSEGQVMPFANVTVTDPNFGGSDVLTITITGAGGVLSGTGITANPDGTYTIADTTDNITNDLQNATFTPDAGQANTNNTSTFTLADVSSVFGTPTIDTSTTVINSDPAVVPTITFPTAEPASTAKTPFAGVTVGDLNADSTDTLTITVTGAAGTISGTGLTGGTGGVYTLTGTGAAVTTALDTLVFTPAATQKGKTTDFALSDTSSAFSDPATANVLYSQVAGARITATGSGDVLVAGASGQKLVGTSDGGEFFYGVADTNFTVLGDGNTVVAAAGTHSIALGSGNNDVVSLLDGNNTIRGSGNGNTITAGNGNDILSTFTGNTTITFGNGTDVVRLTGAMNTVTVGNGNDIVYAGMDGNETVTAGNGSDRIIVGGGGDIVTAGNGADTIHVQGDGDTLTVGSGTDTLWLQGAGDTLTVNGAGSDTVYASAGGDMIRLGTGTNTIKFTSAGGNTLYAAGNTTIHDSVGGNTIVLTAAGQGTTTTYGHVLTNGDMFDLTAALNATTWNGSETTLANYLMVSQSGNAVSIGIDVTGTTGGAVTQIALLQGVGKANYDNVLANAITGSGSHAP